MRLLFLVILCSFLIPACSSKDKVPSGILSQERMRPVLADMMRADQFLSDYVFSKDSSINRLERSIHLYQQVFTLHQVSKEEFKKSFEYYRARPDLFKALMDSIGGRTYFDPATVTQPIAKPDTLRKKFNQPVKTN